MTTAEAKIEIMGLRERFAAPYSQTDKDLIRKLYLEVMGVSFRPTSCQNCYHDAVILIYNRLKNYDKMANEKAYWLKNGAIICSPLFKGGTIYSNANLTDEIAAEYLAQFPAAAKLFARVGTPKAATEEMPASEVKKAVKRKKKAEK